MKIKRGATRTVLLAGRYAFKFPYLGNWRQFLQGLLCNLQERDFSRMSNSPFCPVLWALPGGFLLVMPRCKEANWSDIEVLVQQDFGFDWTSMVEMKRDSFGRLAGRTVVVDYGS